MYISTAPAAAAGASVLGVSLVASTSDESPVQALASTGAHPWAVTLLAIALIALAFVLVAWTAKHPRP